MMSEAVSNSLAGAALTMAAITSGMPLAIGFVSVGLVGATVGHARWTLERERKEPQSESLPLRKHLCMILRAILMAEFVCLILFLAWTEYQWSWTWGLITGAIASVFASDAIELMWQSVQNRFKKMFT